MKKLFCAVFLATLIPSLMEAAGVWAPLVSAPPVGVNNCLLLSDGNVLGMNGAGQCVKLTPDIHGSYRNGTWSMLATMNDSRLFCASQVLTNCNVFVAGGEYGTGHDHAELYDPLNNVWTRIPDPVPGVGFSDAISEMLPNGNVIVAPVSQFGGCLIYSVAANSWQSAGSAANQNETCWVKLTNDNIITIDTGSQSSEHYVPALNQWFADGSLPVPLYGFGAELGAGFLLPNGKVFYIGGTTNTAIYTPGATVTSAGTWTGSSSIPNNLGAVDAPAAMMVNGKVLCALGPVGGFNGPTSFYEYDYTTDTFTQVGAPGGGSTFGPAPYVTSMLDLPDGSVLFVAGQNSSSLYIYTPDGTPLAAGVPVINSITENADGSYHLSGLGLNGISEGAAYGDDEQMSTSRPWVRMTNTVSGNVYYTRTYNWSSTSVQTGGKVLTTEFMLPQGLPAGTYSLVEAANGNPSTPTNFVYAPPTTPTSLTADSGSNAFVSLKWNASAGASAYNVKRSATSTGYFSTRATISGTNYTDAWLTNGIAYYYEISAIGSGGPSSNSPAVSATPDGPLPIPGSTQVSLWSSYNRVGIYTDGITFSSSGGLDGAGNAYSANLLGQSVFWKNQVFNLGTANTTNVVSCAGQNITLPAGSFGSLSFLASANSGSQSGTFTVTYADGSISNFTQSFSDWLSYSAFSGESSVVSMSYYDKSDGTIVSGNTNRLYGYTFTLNPTKTLQSITLPNNTNIEILAMALKSPSGLSWTQTGVFNNNSVLALAGPTNNEVYGVDFGGAGALTTANGYTFADYNTSGNMSIAGSVGTFAGYLTGGATTGDANLNNILTHGIYGGTQNTGTLKNLMVGQAYTVLVLVDDTRGGGAGGTTFTCNDGVTTSPSQQYAFTNGLPSVGGYIMGTFTAMATTQAFSIQNLSGAANSQYNAILLMANASPIYLAADTRPAFASVGVGQQVTFSAAFYNFTVPALNLQWQFIANGVTNNINTGVINVTNNSVVMSSLTLTNLQFTNSGSYRLEAINATNSANFVFSTPATLTVSPIVWLQTGVFNNNSVLALAGPTNNEVYGVDFGGAGALTTANGYTFADYNTSGNMSIAGSVGTFAGYLTGGATTGDANLNNILTHGIYGGTQNTGTLKNLMVGQAYTVLVLVDDTRGGGAGGTTFTCNDGVTTSPSQQYAFANGSPSVGGYILGTFTATATTQALSIQNLSAIQNSQYNAILLEKVVVTPATLGTPKVSGGNLILTGAGGTPNSGYTWLTTTNLTISLTNWTVSVTGTLDGTGAFSNAIPINATQPTGFFRLRLP